MATSRPHRRTFTTLFQGLCERNPFKEMMVTYDESMERKALNFREAMDLSSKFAHLLTKQGLRRGQVVTSTLPPSLEATVVNIGVMLAGGVVVTVDVVSGDGNELFHVVNKGKSKFVVLRSDIEEDTAWQVMKEGIVKGETGFFREFNMAKMSSARGIILANREQKDENGDGFLDFLRRQTETYIDEGVEETDNAMIFLTSGTTGLPKLALYSHKTLVDNADCGEICLRIDEQAKYYVACSWSWAVATPVDILWKLVRVSPDGWRPAKDALRLHANIIKTEDVRSGFMSPISASKIIDIIHQSHPGTYVFDQLFVAGVPMNQVLAGRLLQACQLLTVRYGSTEHLTMTYNHIEKVSDVIEYDCGCLYPGCEVRIVDEDLVNVRDGEPGRILIKTVGTFRNYLNDPEKTANSKVQGDWYNTSDCGYIRPENKHLVVIGRYDYLITHKSTNIYPAWIERPIRDHPEVKDVVVIPVPHEVNNHNICACVIKKPGSNLTTADIQSIIRKLPPQENGRRLEPPHHVMFFDAFPGNARGKIVMNKLVSTAQVLLKKQMLISKEVLKG